MQRKLITVLLGLLMILTLFGSLGVVLAEQEDAGRDSELKISKVTMTFHGDPTTAKGFTWYTPLASTSSDLQVVEKVGSTPDFSQALTFTGENTIATYSDTEVVHKAVAKGLKPDTTYYFRVGDAVRNLWSNVGTFQTAANSGAFTFINLADSQAEDEAEAALSAQTFAKAYATVRNAKFMAVNGDLVEDGMIEQEWDWLLGASEETLLNMTIVPAAGNHEADYNSFLEHFHVKPAAGSDTMTGAYYSFDYSNAHFIVLNSNEGSEEYANFSSEQIHWLREDARAAKAAGAEWLIVLLHKGPYTTSSHADDYDIMEENGVRTKVVPILSELGVDLVLQGHDHIYARTKPIKNGFAMPATKVTGRLDGRSVEYTVVPDGTIYMIPGTAGAKVYFKLKKMDQSYYDLFEVADEHHAAAYGHDPFDYSRPVRGVIQNFVGITVEGRRLTAVTYEIDQNKNDGEPFIIDQFGIIK